MDANTLWQIQRVAFMAEKRLDAELKDRLDIGFAQYKVLEAINQQPLAKQSDIARMLDQTEAGISRQIGIMKKKRLIKVNDVMGNRRARELSLTMQGEEAVYQAGLIVEMVASNLSDSVSPTDAQRLSSVLSALLTRLHQE